VLAERREAFTEVLDGITGRTEWGVKVYAGPAAQEPEPEPEPEPEVPGGGGGAGTAYLRRRQDQRRRRQDAARRVGAQAEAMDAELAGHAAAVRHHPPQDPRLSGRRAMPVLNAAYLVDDERAGGFLEAARSLGARMAGIEVEVTGPWPPYSFIGSVEGA
jgi:hypothetical protein